ncbi:hypothetical protein FXO38_35886 [Capsicum annuum]|nr:hypothetical protein FXO37_36377 [Capsicum annuum]KAF3614058.1 hypothetical protein FXO38_35886 [Capsicum annuum]
MIECTGMKVRFDVSTYAGYVVLEHKDFFKESHPLLTGDAERVCIGDTAGRQARKLIKVEPFNSIKKYIGVVLGLAEGGLRTHTKGSLEIILASCDKVINSSGEVVILDETSTNHLKTTIDQFVNKDLRTFCLEYIELEKGFSPIVDILIFGYTCIGIVGINDHVRPGVRESVTLCCSAGVNVRKVTSDNINTTTTVTREYGILIDAGIAIEGPVFRDKSQEQILNLIP